MLCAGFLHKFPNMLIVESVLNHLGEALLQDGSPFLPSLEAQKSEPIPAVVGVASVIAAAKRLEVQAVT